MELRYILLFIFIVGLIFLVNFMLNKGIIGKLDFSNFGNPSSILLILIIVMIGFVIFGFLFARISG
jgi:hypothetical protein